MGLVKITAREWEKQQQQKIFKKIKIKNKENYVLLPCPDFQNKETKINRVKVNFPLIYI